MGDRTGLKPVMRLMTIVLSNGATLRMPTAAVRTKPFVATQVRARAGKMSYHTALCGCFCVY